MKHEDPYSDDIDHDHHHDYSADANAPPKASNLVLLGGLSKSKPVSNGIVKKPSDGPEDDSTPSVTASSTDPQPTEEEVPRSALRRRRPSAATPTVPLKRLHFEPEAYAKPPKQLGSLCSLGCCTVWSQGECKRCVNKRCPVRATSYPYAGSDRAP